MEPVHWDDVPESRRDVGQVHGAWRDLATAAGGDRLGIQRVIIDANARSTAPHVHGDSEEIFLVVAGEGLLWRDGASHRVRAGDVIVHRVREDVHALRAGERGLTVLACGPRPMNLTWWPRIGSSRVGAGTTPAFEGVPWHHEEAVAGPLPFPEPTPRPPTVVALSDVESVRHDHGTARFAVRDAGGAAGARRTRLHVVDLDPDAHGYPPHCHSHDEEHAVVLAGAGWLQVGDERHALRAGHITARRAGTGVAHAFEAGPDGLQLAIYGTAEPGDIAYYPRSGALRIAGLGVVGRLEPADLWEAEEAS